ncbi:hypothetical protein [Frankia sp. R43]|uniref:hypothetical protein n=1 Tax=Frankia sp. R43 TaxID=269536 RepID=UPI00128F9FEA|nr:hypothetical protein [Frankia sp. R43]
MASGAPVVCPLCGGRLAGLVARCPACRGDLSALVAVQDLADHRFNEAVRAARERRWDEAAAALAATLAITPDDTEALGLLRKVRYHQRQASRHRRQSFT